MKNILLIGLGRFGRHTARKLNELGHQVMAVDKREQNVNAVLPYVTSALIGDAADPDFLATLGVNNYDVCIVTIGDDFQGSLVTTTLLKEAGARFVVSRASQDIQEKLLLANGADRVIYPEKQLAEWTAIRYSSDYILDYIAINDEFAVYEIEVPEKWAGQSLAQLDLRRRCKINVVAVKMGDTLSHEVHPDEPLTREQSLLVLARGDDLQKSLR